MTHENPVAPGHAAGIPDEKLSSFHVGQVWKSMAGTLYTVIEVRRGVQATLRLGTGLRGRIIRRPWDAVDGWVLHEDSVAATHGAAIVPAGLHRLRVSLIPLDSETPAALGFVTVNLNTRTFSLGVNTGVPRPGRGDHPVKAYSGQGWRRDLLHDAIAALAAGCRVPIKAVRYEAIW